MTLADHRKLTRPMKKRRKAGQKEHSDREEHADSAGSVNSSTTLAMLKTAPLACERKAT
jgi:hypothetical protein